MRFSEMKYQRPDIEEDVSRIRHLLREFAAAKSAQEQGDIVENINSIRATFSTAYTLCVIRNSINTQDEYYREEKRFFDENMPSFTGVETEYYRILTASGFRNDLERQFGKQLFRIADVTIKTFVPEITDDLKQESMVTTEYHALLAAAQIPFNGELLTLPQLGKYLSDSDRKVRRDAHEARFGFFHANEPKFDAMYDKVVSVRTQMANKLGHKTFTQLGYDNLGRTDYTPDMVARFRQQVLTKIVPVAQKLRERQKKRIGVDDLMYFDERVDFPSGNPTPKGNPEWIIQAGRQMYGELSPETNTFFTYTIENELLDLLSRNGKRVGGFCTYLMDERAPFIFANCNGTARDVIGLTHEGGHAFNMFMSRETTVPEYTIPTYEAAEVHSMSMEYFTWDWMDLFFQEEADKFRFQHLNNVIVGMPYFVAVDEFELFVYDNPDATPLERKQMWRNIERKYMPERNYSGNDYLENGGSWHQQPHIFQRPFYYIGYALASICAIQFWKRMHDDRERAWSDYLKLCKLSGSKSFTELLKEVDLISPFEMGCVESVMHDVINWLDSVDDSSL